MNKELYANLTVNIRMRHRIPSNKVAIATKLDKGRMVCKRSDVGIGFFLGGDSFPQ